MANTPQQQPQETIVNENVSVLLDQLLKAEDPATIGIRRILRNKIDDANSFPLKTVTMETFESGGKPGMGGKRGKDSHVFTEQERSYLELEKRVREVERTLTQERLANKRALTETLEKGKAEGFAAGEKAGRDKAKAVFDAEIAKLKDQTEILQTTRRLQKNDDKRPGTYPPALLRGTD